MKKYTFEELVDNESWYATLEGGATIKVLDFENVLDLLKQVRQATLQEAANKSKADCTILAGDCDKEFIRTYVLKHSILDLDKDSIEVDERKR